MSSKTSLSAGFFVKRNSLTFFSRNLEDVVEITLSSQIMTDLEIVSQANLERVLANWVEQIKLTPGPICLLLDNSVYFDATLQQMPADESEPPVQAFLDTVPFNDPLVKYFPVQSKVMALAVNQGFLQPLISALEKVGFVVLCVAPAFVLNADFTKTPFSKEHGTEALSDFDTLNQFNFIPKTEVDAKITPPRPFLSVQINARLITMVLVFLVLIAVLGGVLYMQMK